ncbi:MAG: hypothetical protein HEQ39_06300 [Rhizobacter sp.]
MPSSFAANPSRGAPKCALNFNRDIRLAFAPFGCGHGVQLDYVTHPTVDDHAAPVILRRCGGQMTPPSTTKTRPSWRCGVSTTQCESSAGLTNELPSKHLTVLTGP